MDDQTKTPEKRGFIGIQISPAGVESLWLCDQRDGEPVSPKERAMERHATTSNLRIPDSLPILHDVDDKCSSSNSSSNLSSATTSSCPSPSCHASPEAFQRPNTEPSTLEAFQWLRAGPPKQLSKRRATSSSLCGMAGWHRELKSRHYDGQRLDLGAKVRKLQDAFSEIC